VNTMAFPTYTDLEFYRSRQPLPSWVRKLKKPRPTSTMVETAVDMIDTVVRAHAGIQPSSGELAAHNLQAILRSYRRRGLDLRRELRKIAANPECAIHPEKRAAFARKWASRLRAHEPQALAEETEGR